MNSQTAQGIQRLGLTVFLVHAAPFFPGRARACSLWAPSPHTIDPAQVGVDQTPPQLAQPTVTDVQKNETDQGVVGCTPKCGSDYSALLTNLATDDMTPVDRIGYRVTLVAGPAPGPNTRRTGAVLAGTDGLRLFWDGDDDFDFTIQVNAIDAAGNESAPRTVQISSGGGCSVGGQHSSDGFGLAVLALALASARARPQRRR